MRDLISIFTSISGETEVNLDSNSEFTLYVAAIGAVAAVVVAWINTRKTGRVARQNSIDHGISLHALEQLSEDIREIRSELHDHVSWELEKKYLDDETVSRLKELTEMLSDRGEVGDLGSD